MKKRDELRERVIDLLRGGGAHALAEDALSTFPPALRGTKPAGSPHTAWELLEHMRIAQWDLLEYSRTPGFESPHWPSGYWPATSAPPDRRAWSRSVRALLADRQALIALVASRRRGLLAPLAHAPDTNLLLEVFLAASHNSYHLGQVILLRRMLEAQRKKRRKATRR
jgi:hypothetical protein